MAEADWTQLTGAISGGSLLQGVTAGIPKPNGGGSFVYGFSSLDTTAGVGGLFCNLTDFAPTAKGGSIRGCVKRGRGGGKLNFAPLLFVGLQGATTTDAGYLIGLSDEDPSRIMLRKGALSDGLPGVAVAQPPIQGVLAKSTATYPVDTWLQLRLDMIVNLDGDVVLNAYQSDLTLHACTSPVWTAIPGIDQFIDDVLEVNTGSAPLLAGRIGFAFQTKDVTRRGYFDQMEVIRQT